MPFMEYYSKKVDQKYEDARQANEAGDTDAVNSNLKEAATYENEIKRKQGNT